MRLVTVFTSKGSPALGLSPTVKAVRLSDQVEVLAPTTMTELGDGWYCYDWSAGDPTEQVAATFDAGTDAVDSRIHYGMLGVTAKDVWTYVI